MIKPPFFPARPVNGGPLEYALPKTGDWTLEGKYNGYRSWVHNPTGAMFNRDLQPLSISHEFNASLATLKRLPWEWSDVEALERRHAIGRGSLILLDYVPVNPNETYVSRKSYIHFTASQLNVPVHKELNQRVADNTLYLPMTWRMDAAAQLWSILQQCNAALGVPFWEGFVAKLNASIYPRQILSASREFPFWMKHRWAF